MRGRLDGRGMRMGGWEDERRGEEEDVEGLEGGGLNCIIAKTLGSLDARKVESSAQLCIQYFC